MYEKGANFQGNRLTWKELAKAFNKKFGPTSKHPVILDRWGAIPEGTGIIEFLQENILTGEANEQLTQAHFKASLFLDRFKGPFLVKMFFTMLHDHPLWDATLKHNKDSFRSDILTISRKKRQDGTWGIYLNEDNQSDEPIKVTEIFGLRYLEKLIWRDYNDVKVISDAIKKIPEDDLVVLRAAMKRILGNPGDSRLDLYFANLPGDDSMNQRNLYLEENRKRFLRKLAAFEGKDFEESAPNRILDISLRDYIAEAEVCEGKTCPPDLVDAALDYILNGNNDLLERLDGIVAEAVAHVTKSRCPYSVDGDCELCPEDNPCRGTQSEQYECAFRQK
ncbi:MAG: hypothetical protein II038_11180 [Lachnospiraceae bacterium]|nr:hypothetical protein [Lachnospiraceae bacterium]